LELTATNGQINQTGGALSVTTGPTNLNAGTDITLESATNDFNGAVNADGVNISIVDINDLTLGDVTATGKLDATAATDLTLNGTVSVNELELTATNGQINQTGGALSVTTGPTNLNAGTDITLESATNDFNGAVNADGVNISIVDINDLTLGDVTATGNLNATAADDLVLNGNVSADTLDLTATNGQINQTGGALSVTTGPTNLSAGTDITLASATNDFNGLVNAEGVNISMVDINDLTLGVVKAIRNLDLMTTGDLVFGSTTVGGALSASTNGGDISQTGALRVEGKALFDAGSGSVNLSNSGNYFPSGTEAIGSSVVIIGDSNATGNQMSAGMLYQDVTIAESTNANVPAREVLTISDVEDQRIKMSLCISIEESTNLTCEEEE
jgi:hypothetical protein